MSLDLQNGNRQNHQKKPSMTKQASTEKLAQKCSSAAPPSLTFRFPPSCTSATTNHQTFYYYVQSLTQPFRGPFFFTLE